MVNAHKDSYDVKEVAKEVAKDGITFDETKVDKKGKCAEPSFQMLHGNHSWRFIIIHTRYRTCAEFQNGYM